MSSLLRLLFFAAVVRPVMLVVLGLNVRHRERLPLTGPAILVANHNSHLDTMALMSLFPLRLLPKVRPVAAMDYFLRNAALAWFAQQIIGILPIPRRPSREDGDPFAATAAFLAQNGIVVFYPEGSRGEPEQLTEFKTGIAHLARRFPDVPVYPIYLHGFGKALPKGEAVLVPFFCDVFIGEPVRWTGDKQGFVLELHKRVSDLAAEGSFAPWD